MEKFLVTTPYQEQLLQGLAKTTAKIKFESAVVLLQCIVRGFLSKRRTRLEMEQRALLEIRSSRVANRLIDEVVTFHVLSLVGEVLPLLTKERDFNQALVDVTLDLCSKQVDALIIAAVRESVVECTNAYLESRKKKANPIVQIITGILDEVLAEEILTVVKLAINDIINEFLLTIHCNQAFDKIYTELIGEIGVPIVEESWQEVDEIAAINSIFDEVFVENISEISKAGLQEMILENSELYEQTQLNHVGNCARKVIGQQIILNHLMYLTSKKFDSILVQRMAKGLVNINAMGRLLSILKRSEHDIKQVLSNRCSKTLLKSAIEPVLKDVLLENLKYASCQIVDQIDTLESES